MLVTMKVSPSIQEFYNKVHDKSTGRFASSAGAGSSKSAVKTAKGGSGDSDGVKVHHGSMKYIGKGYMGGNQEKTTKHTFKDGYTVETTTRSYMNGKPKRPEYKYTIVTHTTKKSEYGGKWTAEVDGNHSPAAVHAAAKALKGEREGDWSIKLNDMFKGK